MLKMGVILSKIDQNTSIKTRNKKITCIDNYRMASIFLRFWATLPYTHNDYILSSANF
ncbi:hypothetical protein AY601_4807 [Pedobacter cryoconitis]|uniref:Uncharacterized protein n=1 Tax=Pedobacter cryoconitis TaxID=188932 RepID=A0A127VKA9_9SPHI|nr:hypothetical protein AY601_4807 [Pedobacter cryoconitis]